MEPAITVEQEQEFRENLLAVLGRIASALETANLQRAFPPSQGGQLPTVITNGYTCQRCWQFVPNGTLHSCNNFGTYAAGGE